MRYYADFHIHSKYSRATSRDCDLENLWFWGQKKGLSVIGTGDFTHPVWAKEIEKKLEPHEEGLFKLKPSLEKKLSKNLPLACQNLLPTRFMLTVEISTIYKKGDKVRKVHHLICAPDLESVKKIRKKLGQIGNIKSDGRPILGLDSRSLLEIVLEANENCMLIPAHIWTPWFSVLGARSGFDCIEDCYEDLSSYIYALETGLSSDPPMNWLVCSLDRFQLISNSDAHSPSKLAREANVFETGFNYPSMRKALMTGQGFWGTLEFFPEEGKYHTDGHRDCGVCVSPQEAKRLKGLCPVCAKPFTQGVLHRVIDLADRKENQKSKKAKPFLSIMPLCELIGAVLKKGPQSKTVLACYETLLQNFGPELGLLCEKTLKPLQKDFSKIALAISKMRQSQVVREPGYDGVFGKIRFEED